MYRRPKFLEVLIEIRREMSRQADYDVDLFAEMIRSDKFPKNTTGAHDLNGAKEAEQQREEQDAD